MFSRAKAIAKIGFYFKTPVIFKYSRITNIPTKGMFGVCIPRFNFAGKLIIK
jgi:hypothetical protein